MTYQETVLAVKATLTAYRKGILTLGEFHRDLGNTLTAWEAEVAKDETAVLDDVSFDRRWRTANSFRILKDAGYYNHD